MKRELLWSKLALEEKKLYIRLLLADGYTRDAVGGLLHTTKNAVVGFQHTHLPNLTGKKSGTKEPATSERLEELLEAHTGKKKRPAPQHSEAPSFIEDVIDVTIEPVTVSEVSRKLTTDWRLACQFSGKCAYLALPDTKTCGRPDHDK